MTRMHDLSSDEGWSPRKASALLILSDGRTIEGMGVGAVGSARSSGLLS